MSCEHCWSFARLHAEEYSVVLARAERDGWPCTKNTPEGARLRAGQFWDESSQSDRRTVHVTRASVERGGRREVTQSLDAVGLMGEMVAQASLGHKRFCVGIHPQTEDYPEHAEWEDWSLTFERLAERLLGERGGRETPDALCECMPSNSPYPEPTPEGNCPKCGKISRRTRSGRGDKADG